MTRGPRLVAAVTGLALVVACSAAPQESPTITPSASSTPPVTRAPSPAATPSPPPTPTPEPTPSPTPAARTFTSDDGLLTIEAPFGSIPDDVTLIATAMGAEDLPPELSGIPVRSAFYRLEPDGLTFAQPVTITRRVSLEQLGFDLAIHGLPIISLALRTSDGRWNWLEEQEVATDGEFAIVSGKATHTSQVFGFGGTNFAQYEFEPVPPLHVRLNNGMKITVGVSYPESAPTAPHVTSVDPFADDGLLIGDGEILNSASPGLVHDFTCMRTGQFRFGVGFDVEGLGAGNELFNRLQLGLTGTEVYLGAVADCVDEPASPSPATGTVPTPTEGCVIVVHDELGTFISYLQMELDFGAGDLRRVEVTIRGANDNQPAVGEPTSGGHYAILLGLRQAGPKRIQKVEVTTEDGAVHDVTELVRQLIGGGGGFTVPFPQEPTYGSCPN